MIGLLFIAASVKNNDGCMWVSLTDVCDQERELLIDRAARLLPLTLNYEVVCVLGWVEQQEVAEHLCFVNTLRDCVSRCEQWLFENPLGIKLTRLDELVALAN